MYNKFDIKKRSVIMKVKVNQDACIGCGACAAICDEVFELDDEGLSFAKDENVDESLMDSCKEAIEACPTGAIEEE